MFPGWGGGRGEEEKTGGTSRVRGEGRGRENRRYYGFLTIHFQSHVQSTDSALLSRCFTIKEANDSNLVDPDDDDDTGIGLANNTSKLALD